MILFFVIPAQAGILDAVVYLLGFPMKRRYQRSALDSASSGMTKVEMGHHD